MSRNSNQAFIDGVESGKFNHVKAQIYKLISIEPQTIPTLLIRLNKKHPNQISGRITELLDDGLIRETPSNNQYSRYTIVVTEVAQSNYSIFRNKQRADAWLKQGHAKGYINLLGLKID
jgi:hypothetical protein